MKNSSALSVLMVVLASCNMPLQAADSATSSKLLLGATTLAVVGGTYAYAHYFYKNRVITPGTGIKHEHVVTAITDHVLKAAGQKFAGDVIIMAQWPRAENKEQKQELYHQRVAFLQMLEQRALEHKDLPKLQRLVGWLTSYFKTIDAARNVLGWSHTVDHTMVEAIKNNVVCQAIIESMVTACEDKEVVDTLSAQDKEKSRIFFDAFFKEIQEKTCDEPWRYGVLRSALCSTQGVLVYLELLGKPHIDLGIVSAIV